MIIKVSKLLFSALLALFSLGLNSQDTIPISLSNYDSIRVGITKERDLSLILGKPDTVLNQTSHARFSNSGELTSYFRYVYYRNKDIIVGLQMMSKDSSYVVFQAQYGPKSNLIINETFKLGISDSTCLVNNIGEFFHYSHERNTYKYISSIGYVYFFHDNYGGINYFTVSNRRAPRRLVFVD